MATKGLYDYGSEIDGQVVELGFAKVLVYKALEYFDSDIVTGTTDADCFIMHDVPIIRVLLHISGRLICSAIDSLDGTCDALISLSGGNNCE